MKAARIFDRRDVRVEDIPEPPAPGPGEVLVRIRLSGICGTDVNEYRGGPVFSTTAPHPLTGAKLPQIVGHEFCGDVVATGEGVETVRAGERVAIMPLLYCGDCAACRRGHEQLCAQLGAVGLNWQWGGMSELAIVRESNVAVIPDELTYVQGAMVEPMAVAVNAVTGAVVPGDTVMVAGAGPIGQLAGLAAAAAGATAVYVLEPNERRRARAERLGFSGVLDPAELEDAGFEEAPDGVDVAMECSGGPGALAACIGAVRAGGRVTQTALPHRPVAIDVDLIVARDITITGRQAYSVRSWPRMIRLVASGAVPAERIVTKQIALDDIVGEGFEALLDPAGDDVKVVVAPA